MDTSCLFLFCYSKIILTFLKLKKVSTLLALVILNNNSYVESYESYSSNGLKLLVFMVLYSPLVPIISHGIMDTMIMIGKYKSERFVN